MTALLEERNKRQQTREEAPGFIPTAEGQKGLDSLVERVKRKSHAIGEKGVGKRRKLALK